MAFKNEYVPPLEQETSEFFKKAREILRTGHNKNDAWTVDRENNRVLGCTGRGHEIDDRDEEYWEYLDVNGRYSFTTKKFDRKVIAAGPPKKIALTRDIVHFWSGDLHSGLPDKQIFRNIKEAFQAHGAYCMASQEDECQHTLLWNGLTYGEAMAELAKLTSSGKCTLKDLMALGSRVSVDAANGMAQGSVTLLYSGTVNGVGSGSLIDDMMKQGADVRVIDKTQAGAFLKSPAFNTAFETLTDAMTPAEAKAAGNLLYDARKGPWAEASKRFAADTVGEVRFFGPATDINRQFGAAELPNLLAPNSKITRIEGIAIDELRAMGTRRAFEAITSCSLLSAGYSGFKVVAQDVVGADGSVSRKLASLVHRSC